MTASTLSAVKLLRVVVVDDEPLAREDILQLLAGRADVSVVATCANGTEALDAVRRLQPDVLLLDIRMPGLDGFSVVSQLDRRELPYVVFVTAFDRFAIEAFRVRALDYLLKPVQRARLDEALDRAREQLAKRSVNGSSDAEQPNGSAGATWLTELMVRVGTRDIVVKLEDVDWIQAETYYVRLHLRGRSYLYRERMHVLESQLDPRQFSRVHRSAIVNLERVREIVHDSHGDHVVLLSSGARVKTSHQRWLEFRDIMRQRTRR